LISEDELNIKLIEWQEKVDSLTRQLMQKDHEKKKLNVKLSSVLEVQKDLETQLCDLRKECAKTHRERNKGFNGDLIEVIS
jgi:chromosome segregation ATPase